MLPEYEEHLKRLEMSSRDKYMHAMGKFMRFWEDREPSFSSSRVLCIRDLPFEAIPCRDPFAATIGS